MQLGVDLAEWVASLTPAFEEIHFGGVVGNHPRRSKKPRSKHRWDNGDWTAMQFMRQRLRHYERVHVVVPRAARHTMEVCGRRLLLVHGDGVRSTMVDLPIGGISRFAMKLRAQYAQIGLPIDHVLIGHFHEATMLRQGFVFANGSVKGVDEWGLDQFGGGNPPVQNLLTFHPQRGWLELAPIQLYPDVEPEPVAS